MGSGAVPCLRPCISYNLSLPADSSQFTCSDLMLGRGLSSGHRRSQALHVPSQPLLLGLCCCLQCCSPYIRCLHSGCGWRSLKHFSTSDMEAESQVLLTQLDGASIFLQDISMEVLLTLVGVWAGDNLQKVQARKPKGELHCADVVLQLKAWFCGDLGFILGQVMLKERVKVFLSYERTKQFLSGQGWKMWLDVGCLWTLISVEPHSRGFGVLLDHHTYAGLVGPCCFTMNRSSWRACEGVCYDGPCRATQTKGMR